MARLALLVTAVMAACSVTAKHHVIDEDVTSDAATSGSIRDASAPIDAWVGDGRPAPSVDAGPPPPMDCEHGPSVDADKQCASPAPTCLDSNYLVYYADGKCQGGTCHFTTNVMWCGGAGCVNDSCVPGS